MTHGRHGPYRLALTRQGRFQWYWEIESEAFGYWSRVGLFDDHMLGWSLTRGAALRRARWKLRRFVKRMDAHAAAYREQVPL